MEMKGGSSVKEHIKAMNAPIPEEDQTVTLLGSLHPLIPPW